jgi:uncharacterized iron-regulated protein
MASTIDPAAEPYDASHAASIAEAAKSPAVLALIVKRAEQIRQGHTPKSDLSRSPYQLAHTTQQHLAAATDGLLGNPTAERLRYALRRVEIFGALAMALHDRIAAELRLIEAREREQEEQP